jgi:hypothetical protein
VTILKILNLPTVLYGWETLAFKLNEKCRLNVFANRVVGRIFGSKGGGGDADQTSPFSIDFDELNDRELYLHCSSVF